VNSQGIASIMKMKYFQFVVVYTRNYDVQESIRYKEQVAYTASNNV